MALPIITVTLNPSIDRVVGAGLPEGGVLFAAGKGVNVSRTLARLGGASTCLVLCPDEDRGFFASQIAGLGPGSAEFVPLPAGGRVRRRQTQLGAAGASSHTPEPGTQDLQVDDDHLDAVEHEVIARVTKGALVALCGSCPPGVTAARFASMLRNVIAADASVLVDSSGSTLQAAADTPGLWALKCNDAELRHLAEDTEPTASLVVVTAGAGGLLVSSSDGRVIRARVQLPAERPAIDDIGCGDAATAGLSLSWSRNPGEIEQLSRWAAAAGTASVAAAGPGEIDAGLFNRLAVDRLS